MAPEVAEVIWYAEDSASPITVVKPAAFVSLDLLIAVVWQHNNPSNQSELTTSADWTLEGNCDGTVSDAKVFSHVYDPGDPSTWSFAYRSTADVVLGLFRITGADQAPVITVTSTPTGSTTATMDAPSVLPQGADDLLISIIGAHGNGAAFTVTDPAGMTDLAQVQVSGLYMAMAAAHEALTSSAPTGVRSWTSVSPTGFTGGTISIAVKSPASADPLDPIVNTGPPPWLAQQIAMAQTRIRPTDEPPPPGTETGRSTTAATAAATAVKVASCTGRTSAVAAAAGTETRTDVYIAQTFSSVQSDGGGDGKAITTARTQAGDVLFVAVTDSQSATPPTAPGGWTEITLPDTDQGTNFEVHVYRLVSPAAQTTYTWTVTGGRRTIEAALVRGADTTTILDEADSLETASGTSHASPSVTTLGPNRAILAFNVLRGFPTSAWSQASGWLEYLQRVGADATTNMQVSLQARTAPTATAYSDTFTCAVAEPAIVVLLAVIPAAGAGATAETGTARAAATAAGQAIKVAVQTGRACAAATAGGAARKTAAAAVTATGVATAAGTATKQAVDTGRAVAAATAAGSARKTAAAAARAVAAAVAAGADRKTAAVAGTSVAVARASGTTAGTARPQTGTTCGMAAGAATARKTAATAGTAAAPARCTAAARKTATSTATATAVARAAATSRRTATAAAAGRAVACAAGLAVRRAAPTGRATAAATTSARLVPAFVAALVGLDGGTSAGTTDSAGRSSGAADGRTGSSGHDGQLAAAGSGDSATTATGYL